MSSYIVFFTGLVLILSARLIQPAKTWWQTVNKKRNITLLIILAVTVTFISSGGESVGSMNSARIIRFALIMILFFVSLVRLLRGLSKLKHAGAAIYWMLLFSVLCMLSASYSIDPFVTVWKGFEVMTIILLSISIAIELKGMKDIRDLILILSLVLLFFVITFYVGLALFPSEAIVQMTLSSSIVMRGVGPSMNPNMATQVSALFAAIVFPVALYSKKENAMAAWFLFAIGIGTMLLGHSRTSIFAFILAVAAILYFDRRRLLLTSLVVGGGLSAIILESILQFIYRGQSAEVFTSFTGRLDNWSRAFAYIEESPIIGHGYYAAQRVLMENATTDSTYVNILIGLGFTGLLVFVIPVIISGFKLLATRPGINDSIEVKIVWLQLMSIYVLLVVRSITAASFEVLHPNLIFYGLLLVAVYAYARHRRHAIEEEVVSDTEIDLMRKPPRVLYKKKSAGQSNL